MFVGYNIVGDGTPAALLPILTGKQKKNYRKQDVVMPVQKQSIDFLGFGKNLKVEKKIF
jgi:hypothetical protein